MRSKLFTAIVLLLSASAALAAGPETAIRTISVSGTAETDTPPDAILWQISLTQFDKYLPRAKSESDTKLRLVLEAIGQLGVKTEDVQTGHLRIRREFNYDEFGNRSTFKNYVVTRSLTARQRRVDRFDEFLNKMVSVAEIEVSFELKSSQIEELRAASRLKAVQNAREKAKAMTEALGANLGKVMAIVEEKPPSDKSREDTFDLWPFLCVPGRFGWRTETFMPPVIEIASTVTVTFEIE